MHKITKPVSGLLPKNEIPRHHFVSHTEGHSLPKVSVTWCYIHGHAMMNLHVCLCVQHSAGFAAGGAQHSNGLKARWSSRIKRANQSG